MIPCRRDQRFRFIGVVHYAVGLRDPRRTGCHKQRSVVRISGVSRMTKYNHWPARSNSPHALFLAWIVVVTLGARTDSRRPILHRERPVTASTHPGTVAVRRVAAGHECPAHQCVFPVVRVKFIEDGDVTRTDHERRVVFSFHWTMFCRNRFPTEAHPVSGILR